MKAVFIDLDGVICRNRDDHVKSRAEFEFQAGAREGLRRLARLDVLIVVVTNQIVINRGMVTVQTGEHIYRQMVDEIEKAGGRVDRVLCCPQGADGHCTCREIQPGLLTRVSREMGVDPAQSYFISDIYADIQAGETVGCSCFLVLTGRGHDELRQCVLHHQNGFRVSSDLESAVDAILREGNIGSVGGEASD
ncbi:MAG: HAD-IIIA family hydrolase [Chloroflexota bacterium]|nr:HAD-IIIA family hydrolase [Chloroflexota bacterium]